ncbi:MAG: hypothetical protein P1S59_09465 [bacterium]|nr:hypothetical protein [bacterium]
MQLAIDVAVSSIDHDETQMMVGDPQFFNDLTRCRSRGVFERDLLKATDAQGSKKLDRNLHP